MNAAYHSLGNSNAQYPIQASVARSYLFAFWTNIFYLTSLVAQLVNICLQSRRTGFDPWVGKIPWRRERLPTPAFWPGEVHELYSPWGGNELDMIERLSPHFTSSKYVSMNLYICVCIYLLSICLSVFNIIHCKPVRYKFLSQSLIANTDTVHKKYS